MRSLRLDVASPEEIAERFLHAGQLPEAYTADFVEWTPSAFDRDEANDTAAVLLIRRSGRGRHFALIVVAERIAGDWRCLDEVQGGDRWEADPCSRPRGAGFMWSTGTSGGMRCGRWILVVAGVIGDQSRGLVTRAADSERQVSYNERSGAFVVVVVGPPGPWAPSYTLTVVSRDGSPETLTYRYPRDQA